MLTQIRSNGVREASKNSNSVDQERGQLKAEAEQFYEAAKAKAEAGEITECYIITNSPLSHPGDIECTLARVEHVVSALIGSTTVTIILNELGLRLGRGTNSLMLSGKN